MQSDYKHISKLTSLKTNVNEEVYNDIANFVFYTLAQNMKKPKGLIYNLLGIGFWFLRRKRLLIKMNMYNENHQPDWASSLGIDGKDIPEIMKIFKDRLEEYDIYMLEKNEVKKKRNEIKSSL